MVGKVADIKLILGVDETWFDKMYLVCQELSSGYIFVEDESEKLLSLLPKCEILYFVSDRAKALINLAKEKNKVPSVADIFHFKYNINKLLCLALSSKLRNKMKHMLPFSFIRIYM